MTPPLREALEFIRDIVPLLPPLVLDLNEATRPPLIVYSDAIYEEGADVEDGGGWVVLDRETWGGPVTVHVGLGATPWAVRRRLLARKTYIGQLELAWADSPMRTLPEVFRGRYAIHFVDNTSAIAGLVKGYSGKLDSAMIVMSASTISIQLHCVNWYAYVNTKANIADFPSRFEMLELLNALRRLGIDGDVRFVSSPVLPSLETWRAAAGRWLASIAQDTAPPDSLVALRGKWRHMVKTIPNRGTRRSGHVYVGRNPRHGQTRYGNKVLKCNEARSGGRTLREAHECCVMAFAGWLAARDQYWLRMEVRHRLKGRTLACHCPEMACRAMAKSWPPWRTTARRRHGPSGSWAPGHRAGDVTTLAAAGHSTARRAPRWGDALHHHTTALVPCPGPWPSARHSTVS